MNPRLSSLRPLLADLRRRVADAGWKGLLADAGQRLRTAVRSEEQLIVLLKDLDEIAEPRLEGDLVLEDLEARHLPALYELNRKRSFERADRRFARAVADGYRGYVAFRDGELVGYYWWVDASVEKRHPDLERLGLGIELGAEDVYGSDFFMLESHRGGGRAVDFLFKLESDLRRRGYRKLWGYVVSTNRPARWLYSSRGYRPMWTVLHKTVLMRRRIEIQQPETTEASA
jgi:GNAT superfamily N-acetyltransferase